MIITVLDFVFLLDILMIDVSLLWLKSIQTIRSSIDSGAMEDQPIVKY